MPQASSTPAGFPSATPYLIFDGTAADAIAFYRDVFAATELPGRLTHLAGRILDAAILIGDSVTSRCGSLKETRGDVQGEPLLP
jgi:uncharacterized glyoxalase superfamily protein PhnB